LDEVENILQKALASYYQQKDIVKNLSNGFLTYW